MVAMVTHGYWFPVNRTDSANNMFLKAKLLLAHSTGGSNGHNGPTMVIAMVVVVGGAG